MPTLVADLDSTGFVSGAYKMYASLSALVTYLSDAQRKMELMENTLVTYTGSIEGSKRVIEDLADISLRLGSNFEASVVPFAKLAGSIQTLSESETLNVFEGFQTALTATHASTNAVTGAWLALQQVVSKGKLNMQDLRRQLAEHIPGAMKIFADAAGMSMEQFEKAVREGSINVEEWLVKAADAMKENFGGAAVEAAKSLDAELNRLHTTSLLLRADFVESSGLNETFTGTVSDLVKVLNGVDLTKFSGKVKEATTRTEELTEKLSDAILKTVEYANKHSDVIGNIFDTAIDLHPLKVGIDRAEMLYDNFIDTEKEVIDIVEDGYKKWYETAEEFVNRMAILEKEAVKQSRKAALDKVRDAIHAEEMGKKAKEVAALAQKRLDAQEAENRIKVQEEMYKKLGLFSEEHSAQMKIALLEETKNWVQYGATQEQVTKYIEDTLAKSQGLLITMDELGNYTNMAGEETDRFGNTIDYVGRASEEAAEETGWLVDEVENLEDATVNTGASIDDYTSSMNDAATATKEAKTFLEEYNGIPLTAALQRKIADDKYVTDLKAHQEEVRAINEAAYQEQADDYRDNMADRIKLAQDAVDKANDYAIAAAKEKAQQLYDIEEKRIQDELSLAQNNLASDDTKLSAMRQMFNEQEVVSSEYYQAEADARMRQAQEWKDAGVNALMIEQWLQGEFEDLRTEATEAGVQGLETYIDSLWASSIATGNFSQDLVDAQDEISALKAELDALQAAGVDSFMDEASASMQRFNKDVRDAQNYLSQLVNELARFNNSSGGSAGTSSGSSGGSQSAHCGVNEYWDANWGVCRSRNASFGSSNAKGNTIYYNFNQKVSRNDINNITSDQRRNANR